MQQSENYYRDYHYDENAMRKHDASISQKVC